MSRFYANLLLGGAVAMAKMPALAASEPEVRSFDPHPQCMARGGLDADTATGDPDCYSAGVQDCCWRNAGDAVLSPGKS